MAVLTLHRNGESGRTDPSVARMAEETGLGRRTVIRALASLEAREWLSAQRRSGIRTRYALAIPTSATETPVPQGHQCQPDTGPVPQGHRTSATQAPERTKNERRNERDTTTDALWGVFVEEMDGKALTLTDKRRSLLKALHTEELTKTEGNPVEAFRMILRVVKGSEFYMGNRDYHMIESLFRSKERRERWAERARTGKSKPAPLLMSSAELMAMEERL